jgi:uncharacterized protein (UPF0264 family)
MAELLVSVRSADEVPAALAGGAAVIDVKDPERGAMGRPSPETVHAVAGAVAGRVSVSAALGELLEWPDRDPAEVVLPDGLGFVKMGLAACRRKRSWEWRTLLPQVRRRMEEHPFAPLQRPKWVAVAYADSAWAQSPAPLEILRFAAGEGFSGLLLDTWEKNDNRLTDWMILDEMADLVARCRAAGLTVALAGSLREEDILSLGFLAPDLFAVRGAACGGRRDGAVDAEAVRRLVRAAREARTADGPRGPGEPAEPAEAPSPSPAARGS